MSGAPNAAGDHRQSLILALHARYEAAAAEFNRLDDARPSSPKLPLETEEQREVHALCYRLDAAMKVSQEEMDLVRRLILRQMPCNDEELAVLASHLFGIAVDRDPQDIPTADWSALEWGLIHVFDFLASEGRADAGKMGNHFSGDAMLAFQRVRLRIADEDHLRR